MEYPLKKNSKMNYLSIWKLGMSFYDLAKNSRFAFRTQSGTAEETESPADCLVGKLNLYQVINGIRSLRVWTQIIQLSGLRKFLTDKSISVTMFAPMDAAFEKLLAPGTGFGELVPQQDIARVLVSYHTVLGAATTRQIKEDLKVGTMLLDDDEESVEISLEQNLDSPSKLVVSGRESRARIVKTNIIACNSVIHIIDGVLLPYEDMFPTDTLTLEEAVSYAANFTSWLNKAKNKENKPKVGRRRSH
eukprot:g8596.t1